MTEFEMAAYADQALGASDLERIEAHLADCRECRRELVEITDLRPAQPERWLIRFAPLAAAAIIGLAILFRGSGTSPESGFRDPTLTLAAPPTLVAPLGEVEVPGILTWSSVPHASRYRITIFNEDGATVWEQQALDTVVQLPDSVPLSPGTPYFWKVAAQLDRGRWVSSELTRFSLSHAKVDR